MDEKPAGGHASVQFGQILSQALVLKSNDGSSAATDYLGDSSSTLGLARPSTGLARPSTGLARTSASAWAVTSQKLKTSGVIARFTQVGA